MAKAEKSECLDSRIQIVNNQKLLDGKFYVLDSDEDSVDEELYSTKEAPTQQMKRKTYKRAKKQEEILDEIGESLNQSDKEALT